MSLASYLEAAPKIELHVHLEGSIRQDTALELARRNGIDLGAATADDLARKLAFHDFAGFARAFMTLNGCVRSGADIELVTLELGRELRRQNVRYAEVTTSPAVQSHHGIPEEDYLEGLARGRERARSELGVELSWVFDIVRNIRDEPRRTRLADRTVELAIGGREAGVVALGLGGIEEGHPAAEFAPWFDRARAAGLGSVPHAGETVGPESVRQALDLLGADRLGHGVRAIEDPALVARLARDRITLEVCPTSNLRIGVCPSLRAHPLPRLLEAGVAISIGSDDPALFGTTLTDELLTLDRPFGLDRAAIDGVLLEGARSSFLPRERRVALVAEMTAELRRLAPLHLPEDLE